MFNYNNFVNENRELSRNMYNNFIKWITLGNYESIVQNIEHYGKIVVNYIPDRTCVRPLTWAVKNGKNDIVKLLVESGAKINAKGIDDETSLHVAVNKNNIEIVRYLLNNGADINSKEILGWTPLMNSISNQFDDITYFLVNAGADINSTSKSNETPLMAAALCDNDNLVNKLLELNADISVVTSPPNERTALSYTCKGIWKTVDVQELIITRQPWNIKFFDDRIGFLPELKVKYKDAFYISDLGI